MATTFDEAQNLLLEQDLDDEVAPLVIYEMSVLKDTYAPTIEMTKAEKTMLLNYLEMSSLREFMDVILYQDGNLYEKLSDEDIVQAWLHPETIKVVD